ncbi:MAG: hypothetical protein JWP91_2812 [Fibrobacteres bacterium]|nr:hypothetical protein [Fibrobacterota bacterium]
MIRSLHKVLALGLTATVPMINAFEIKGTAPQVEFHTTNPLFTPSMKAEFQTKMNTEVATAFNTTIDTARAQLAGFKQQKELAQGFANANAYSVQSATLQGFQNYSLFAVATGLMVGVQAPSTSVSYYSKIADDIQKKGDLYAGLGAGFSFANVGVNAGFLLPGLYLNAKYGAFDLDVQGFAMDFSVMGAGINYRLLEPKSLIGLVKWRGISVGSGFYMQSSKINMTVTPDTIQTDAHFRAAVLNGATGQDKADKEALLDEMGYTASKPDAAVKLSPEFNMGIDVTTMTIPVDAVTAVSLLWGMFNITGGLGFDLNFGSNEIVLKGDSKANIGSNDTTKVTFTPATVTVDGGTKNGPSFARLRAMTGLGLGLGPVKIDVPLIYYFNSGVAFGLTVAVVW